MLNFAFHLKILLLTRRKQYIFYVFVSEEMWKKAIMRNAFSLILIWKRLTQNVDFLFCCIFTYSSTYYNYYFQLLCSLLFLFFPLKIKKSSGEQKSSPDKKKIMPWKANFKSSACNLLRQTFFFFKILIWPYNEPEDILLFTNFDEVWHASRHQFAKGNNFSFSCPADEPPLWYIMTGPLSGQLQIWHNIPGII